MVNVAPKFYHLAIEAFHKKDIKGLLFNAYHFLDMLKDLDAILATNKNFLLGTWLEEAKSIASRSKYRLAESALYEYNARNQITLWGPNGEILDYATKQWSGIVSDYYYPRWEMFYHRLAESIVSNTTYDQDKYKKDFIEYIGKPFTFATDVYPNKPVGDSITVAKKLYSKWRAMYNPRDRYWQSRKENINCSSDMPEASLFSFSVSSHDL